MGRHPYAECPGLRFEPTEPGVLEIVFDGPGLNAVGEEAHERLAVIWDAIGDDDEVRTVLVRGEGDGFSAGGSFEMLTRLTQDEVVRTRVMHEARSIVRGMLGCSKPIVSAIHGPAVGAGLAVALLADISVAARTARILDGHVRIGVAAGDHAVICWPLLCGMARAKYYLLTAESVSGETAERIGLVSLAVDDDQVLDRARSIAQSLAEGPADALRATKMTLNSWYEQAAPAFEASLALEFLGFGTADGREGVTAVQERRAPRFAEQRIASST